MPEGDDLLTADKVAALLSVSVRTVRRYADTGRLTPIRLGRSVRYRLPDVERLIAEGGDTSGQADSAPQRPPADNGQERPGAAHSGQDTIEAAYRVTPAEIEQAVARTSAQYMGDLRTMLAEVGKVYEGQLQAKDETIAELRRRAEAAEAELARRDATPPPAAPQPRSEAPPPPAHNDTPIAPAPPGGFWQRLRRAIVGE